MKHLHIDLLNVLCVVTGLVEVEVSVEDAVGLVVLEEGMDHQVSMSISVHSRLSCAMSFIYYIGYYSSVLLLACLLQKDNNFNEEDNFELTLYIVL